MPERNATAALAAPARLHAVGRARMLDAAARRVFDRLTDLAATLLDVPIALISVVEPDRQLFLGCVGLSEPWASRRGTPISHSFCQHAVLAAAPLVIDDAREHPLVRDNPAIADLGVVAYAGVPLVTSGGQAIGSFCAIDSKPRAWSESDLRVLDDLAATVIAYVELAPERPPEKGGGLNIAAVARRTGVGADTLRKWERRYGVLRPSRTGGGQRRYDEVDVARVEWLRERLAEGLRIGEASALLEEDVPTGSSAAELRDAIVGAVGDPDTRRLAALVEQAFTLHDVETAVEEIVAPALRTVGDRWQEGAECVAEEHLLSEVVRSHLRGLLADRRHAIRGTAVLACAPGERHELGLLALAVLLQADGWLSVYLGADSPVESSVALAERLEAELLCLSATGEAARDALRMKLDAVELPEGLRVVVGGPALPDTPARLGTAVASLRPA